MTDIDAYLAKAPAAARATLEKLRKTIHAAAPGAAEIISYQVPAFEHHGVLVGFGASKQHCSFYAFSGTALDAFSEELRDYDTSKGTIRFPHDKPLPAALVKKIVRARMAENERRSEKKPKR